MSLYDSDRFQNAAPPNMTDLDIAALQGLYAAAPIVQAHDEQLDITQNVIHTFTRFAAAGPAASGLVKASEPAGP